VTQLPYLAPHGGDPFTLSLSFILLRLKNIASASCINISDIERCHFTSTTTSPYSSVHLALAYFFKELFHRLENKYASPVRVSPPRRPAQSRKIEVPLPQTVEVQRVSGSTPLAQRKKSTSKVDAFKVRTLNHFFNVSIMYILTVCVHTFADEKDV